MVGQAATGIQKVEYKDGKLIFTLPDGSTIDTPLDISSGVAGASLNEEGALVIEFSDGTTLTYAAATKEDLQKVEEKVDTLGENLENLTISHNTLNESHAALAQAFEDLGLSVVDGKLNITYEKENEWYEQSNFSNSPR